MAEVLVLTPERINGKKTPFEKEILWYDPLYKKMRRFLASKLKYVYVKEEYVSTPQGIIPLDEASEQESRHYGVQSVWRLRAEPDSFDIIIEEKVLDEDAIPDWFKMYHSTSNSTAKIISKEGNGLTFVLDDSELEDFLYELDRHRIRFRIM